MIPPVITWNEDTANQDTNWSRSVTKKAEDNGENYSAQTVHDENHIKELFASCYDESKGLHEEWDESYSRPVTYETNDT